MDALAALAEHATRTRYEDLPAAAVQAAKVFVQDTLGVAAAGSAGPWVDDLLAAAGGWGAAPEARAWVRGTRLPAPAAALVNAFHVHGSEFDCIHEAAVVHPMAAVLPAALAQCERQGGASGRDLLAAVVLGVDVACHLGVAARAPLRFFRPATAGAFGAAAAVGRLMGLDAERLAAALGAAYGQLGGTMQPHVEGSPLLALQMGFSARNALVACDLAARGVPALRGALEGPFGYFALFETRHDVAAALATLGRGWRITEVSHKPFPSGRATHALVDALLALRAGGLAADDVEHVTARVPPLVAGLVGRPLPAHPRPPEARLCAAYVGARALLRGTVDLDDFRPGALVDAATHALAGRFAIVAVDHPDPSAFAPVEVHVARRGGAPLALRVDAISGSPARPLSREAHLAKLRRNWASAVPALDPAAGERLINLVDDLEAVRDVRDLVALVCAPA
jgi:aconitate decarboxylase